jgi:hypothetical protein
VSVWEDRIRDHAVQKSFGTALESLQRLSAEQVALGADQIERLVWVINHVRERLNAAPALAVPAQTLEQLNLQVNNLHSEVINYVGSSNAAYLGNANTAADALLEQARVLPPMSPTAKEAEGYLNEVRGLLAAVIGDVDADRSRVREDTEAALEQVRVAKDKLTEQLSDVSTQVTLLQNEASSHSSQLQQMLTKQEADFTTAEARRAAEFDGAEQERADAVAASEQKAAADHTAAVTALTDQAASTLSRLEELQDQAEQLVGAIGVTGVAAGYDQTATREKRAADVWRLATVTVALAAAGILAFAALFTDHGDAGAWQELASRVFVSLSLAGVAAYCGRQSAEHRKAEREARNRHLQLRALNPYLANMPEEESVRLKAELAAGYFTPTPAAAAAVSAVPDTSGGSENSVALPAEKVLDLATALLTKGTGR